jgi:predicted dinucleotide-binding enzyme
MRIAMLGTGVVGEALGTGLVGLGHEVMMGSRDASNEKARAWANKTGSKASVGTFAEAARFGELAVLATLWSGTENALRLAGPENLRGKVVIDATNPLDFSQGKPRLAVGFDDSGGEQVQRWLPGARVVKAFNTIGSHLMVHPKMPGGPPSMFVAGDDAETKRVVSDLCTALGLEPVDSGGIEASRYLEPMCMLWVEYGMRTNGWNHAFRLLKG